MYNFSVDNWTANSNNIGGISFTMPGHLDYGALLHEGQYWDQLLIQCNIDNIGGTVANSIQLAATGTSSQMIGMYTSNAVANFTSNTVRNLTSNIGTGTTTTASVIGISIAATSVNNTLSQNIIYNLYNSTHLRQVSLQVFSLTAVRPT